MLRNLTRALRRRRTPLTPLDVIAPVPLFEQPAPVSPTDLPAYLQPELPGSLLPTPTAEVAYDPDTGCLVRVPLLGVTGR